MATHAWCTIYGYGKTCNPSNEKPLSRNCFLQGIPHVTVFDSTCIRPMYPAYTLTRRSGIEKVNLWTEISLTSTCVRKQWKSKSHHSNIVIICILLPVIFWGSTATNHSNNQNLDIHTLSMLWGHFCKLACAYKYFRIRKATLLLMIMNSFWYLVRQPHKGFIDSC